MNELGEMQLEQLKRELLTKRAMKETGLTFDELMKVRLTLSEDPLHIGSSLLCWTGAKVRDHIRSVADFAILRWFYSPEARLPEFERWSEAASAHILSAERGIGADRDQRRQIGTRKERRPEITQWITKQLTRRPDVKSPELWTDAPGWITDDIGYDAFSKRVTKGRKKLDGRK